jgi:hypothetical protein
MKPWLEITQSDALIVQPSQPVSDQSPIARKTVISHYHPIVMDCLHAVVAVVI